MKQKNLKQCLSIMLLIGAMLFSGCSQDLLETDNLSTTTIKVNTTQISKNCNFSAQSFTNGTVNDIATAKITITRIIDQLILVNNQNLIYDGTAWSAEFMLPLYTELKFVVSSYNDQNRKIFEGTTIKALQAIHPQVTITQIAIEDVAINLIPQILQIVRPKTMSINSTANISFTIATATTGNLSYEIIKDATDTGIFSPQTGTIALDSAGSFTFDLSYYANKTGQFNHKIKLTNRQNHSAITPFNTAIFDVETPAPLAQSTAIDVTFYPVITGLTAESTDNGLIFQADVDYTGDILTHHWTYTKNDPADHAYFGSDYTPAALLLGYNPIYSGKVTFTVQNQNVSTSIEYVIGVNQFPNDVVTDNPSPPPPPTNQGWEKPFYAPYVDACLYPVLKISEVARDEGQKLFVLAFIVAQDAQTPVATWGTYYSLEAGPDSWGPQGQYFLYDEIDTLRNTYNGDYMVSFGGAVNTPLATAASSVDELANEYKRVIDTLQVSYIDFDIEGAALLDAESIERRSKAIAQIQHHYAGLGKPLFVWYTLPAMPFGLTAEGVAVLQSAKDNGVNLDGINIMTMDYGPSFPGTTEGEMAAYGIDAITALHGQLKTLYTSKTDAELWAMIGTTPMIGLNDVLNEIFFLQDAQDTVDFAIQNAIGMVSNWSLNRDHPSTYDYVDNFSTSKGVQSVDYEFLQIFKTVNP